MSSTHSTVTVTVPATTANLGPGFDCFGAALTLYNQFKFSAIALNPSTPDQKTLQILVKGLEADRVIADETNLVYKAFAKFYAHLGQSPPPVEIEIELGVPLARGLGSSATAIAGGLMGANHLAGKPLTLLQLVDLAIDMEKHPDNVVPALLGGCRLAASIPEELATDGPGWEICDVPWHSEIVPVVAIPEFELSTETARQVLPTHYTRADAIYNTAHLGLLLRGLATNNGQWLRVAMSDRLHQPYRKNLIPGYDAVHAAALNAGAYGLTISGAGPTLLALSSPAQSADVATAMVEAWQKAGIKSHAQSVQIDLRGSVSVEAKSPLKQPANFSTPG
ncbi:homoserine kinase [Oscillatoria acuminata]|uniref:Homoserine kinase n=1 Tax=Oscillatoria acuminata PCC 6304 TaxID=56110 RepID=K9TIQ1_9CYAN|nr:homoserine kinase [Oscillatoria acuminata]AFY81894.1 homoserine kinase [Oscillatoria acuminata PCC 6304]